MARDIHALNPELSGWVLHVLVFIVPRQMVELGDPARRSCDACESLGAAIKKIIKHLTCRRRHSNSAVHHHRSQDGKRLWRQTLRKGYIQTAFERVSVRAKLVLGEENKRYLQRADYRMLEKGKIAPGKFKAVDDVAPPTVSAMMEAPKVLGPEAMLALWS